MPDHDYAGLAERCEQAHADSTQRIVGSTIFRDAAAALRHAEKLQEIVGKFQDARNEMHKAHIVGCRCYRDNVSPGCCFQCLFMVAEEAAEAARTQQGANDE